MAGFSSGAALALQAAASGVPMRRLASYEAPYVGITPVNGITPDHLGHLKGLIAKGDRGGAVGYFMVKIVGGPAFLPIMMRMMPKAWKQLKAVAHTLVYDTTIMDGFEVPTQTLGGSPYRPWSWAVARPSRPWPPRWQRWLTPCPGRGTSTRGQTHQVKDAAIAPEAHRVFQRVMPARRDVRAKVWT